MKNPTASLPFRAATLAAFFCATLFASAETVKPVQTIPLFNGHDLTGWVPVAKGGPPPADTWQAADGVIRCAGKPNGYLRTAARYRDYRLTVEWRWTGPAPVDAQGKPRNRNSGVLLHVQPPDAVWPMALEAQLMETNAGDFYVIGGVETAEHTKLGAQAVAAAGTDEKALAAARNNRRIPKAHPSAEKPAGEWNTYDIVCTGDSVTVRVNGVEQNRATGVSVGEGHICLQSEGAAIEFRNITVEPLK
ncbi:MAG: DUF1080 domain-containing protein [Opitutae bacterium]|nr:DUF1080 domain-containing protein [Opitutae bacterium]